MKWSAFALFVGAAPLYILAALLHNRHLAWGTLRPPEKPPLLARAQTGSPSWRFFATRWACRSRTRQSFLATRTF
jgi:hypothetical protein